MQQEERVISAVKDFARSINSGGKVVADMSLLVDATSQLPLSSFDYLERLIRYEFSIAVESSYRSNRNIGSKPSQLLTWLDLISWDGHKREKTLRTISSAAPNAFFFSLAIRRLNDWVPLVRDAARDKLPLIAKETDPVHVVEALCIALSNWHSWGRIEEKGKQVLLQIISGKEIAESLKSKLILSATGPMTSLFAQLGRTPVLDEYLGEISENAIQPSVRAKAYRSQFEQRMVWVEGQKWEWTDIRYCKGRLRAVVGERKISVATPFLELLQKSSKDRSSIVRRVTAEFLIRDLANLGDKSLPLAKCFASDKSSPVKERGLFALKRLKEVEQ